MERLTIPEMRRGGAVALGGLIILEYLSHGLYGTLLTAGACVGASVVLIYYYANRKAPPTWQPLTAGASGGSILTALFMTGRGLVAAAVSGVFLGLALSMVHFGFRGPIDAEPEHATQESSTSPSLGQ